MSRHSSLVVVSTLLFAAACSRGDDKAVSSSPLDRDLTLSAQLQGTAVPPSGTAELVAGGACRTERAPAVPTAARRTEALALEQRAAEAEFAGNIAAARELHRQAARLDGTSEAIAYRLARADEASGDRAAAVAGYCRYLSLAPSAANAKDVRARLSALLAGAPAMQVAKAPAAAPAPVRPTTVAAATPVRRAEGRRVATSGSVTPSSGSSATVAAAPSIEPAPSKVGEADAVSGASQGANQGESVTVASSGEVVAAQQEPVVMTPPSAPTTVRRPADHTARNAAIGAAAGAAVGAMTSRSVKGAVIGGVAGGILGAVVGRAGNKSGFRTPGFAH